VSNVLRGRGRVGSQTRQRVLTAAQQLSYNVHPGASSMGSRRIRQIAHPMPYTELMPITIPSEQIARSVIDRALVELDAPSDRPGELLTPPLTLGDSA
jgi:Bacterial regulatory proteins, lacI family